jgi:gliding motility-associated-like protein
LSEANKNIEDLFKEKLDNHESIVRPDLWNSISSSIPAAGSTATAIALKTKILIGVAAAIITAATVYYFNTSNQSEQQTSPQKTEQSSSPENNQDNQELATANAEIKANSAAEPSKKEADSKDKVVVSTEIPLFEVSDRDSADLHNLNLHHLRTTAIDATEHSTDVAPNMEKTVSVASHPTEAEKAVPPVMQVKEVDNNSLLYFLFSPQKASAYEWWIDDKLVSNNATFNYNFENDGNYEIRLVTTSTEGTKSEAIQSIEVYRNIIFNLPNAFSPNGDGMNDVFNVENGIEYFQKIDRLLIRDKNGKSIYESSTNFIWDGTSMDGNICQSGVYTYTIFATDNKNNPQMKAGTIQLFVE